MAHGNIVFLWSNFLQFEFANNHFHVAILISIFVLVSTYNDDFTDSSQAEFLINRAYYITGRSLLWNRYCVSNHSTQFRHVAMIKIVARHGKLVEDPLFTLLEPLPFLLHPRPRIIDFLFSLVSPDPNFSQRRAGFAGENSRMTRVISAIIYSGQLLEKLTRAYGESLSVKVNST